MPLHLPLRRPCTRRGQEGKRVRIRYGARGGNALRNPTRRRRRYPCRMILGEEQDNTRRPQHPYSQGRLLPTEQRVRERY